VRCPSCLRKLKERCVSCSRPLDQAWTICPYCETEVAAPAPGRRTRRRRTQAAIDAEQAAPATGRPETARAKAAREELDAAADAGEEDGDEQDTRATPVAAAEPAPRPRGGRAAPSSSRRARPST
jgi:hypothetical protein